MGAILCEDEFMLAREWCLKAGVELVVYPLFKECADLLVMRDPVTRLTADRRLYALEPDGQLTEQLLSEMLAEIRGTEAEA